MASMADSRHAFPARHEPVHPPLEVGGPGSRHHQHRELARGRGQHRVRAQRHADALEVLAQDRRPQPGVERARERAVLALDQAPGAALSARAREHRVVEAALVDVELLGEERNESRPVSAHR